MQVSVLEDLKVSKEDNLDMLDPFSRECISTRTLLSTEKSDEVQLTIV